MEARQQLHEGMGMGMMSYELRDILLDMAAEIRTAFNKRRISKWISMLDKASMVGIYATGTALLMWRLMEIF